MAARAKVGNVLCFGRVRMRVRSRPALAKLTDDGAMMAELPIRSVAGRAAACVAESSSSADSWLNALASCVHDRPADASDGGGGSARIVFGDCVQSSNRAALWCGIFSI